MLEFGLIDTLVEKSNRPVPDEWLESLQAQFNQRQNYYRFLYYLALVRQPKTILEIGTYFGIGSAYLAAAAKDYGGQVIGIDLNSHEMTEPLEKSGLINSRYGNYRFIQGDSTSESVAEQVRELVKGFGPIGIVFQDSSHHYRASCQEWDIYTQLLDREAVWICDDITPAFYDPKLDPPGKGMVQYFNERPGEKRLYRNILHLGNAIGVILIENWRS